MNTNLRRTAGALALVTGGALWATTVVSGTAYAVDAPLCNGKAATILGTDGDDTLSGTDGDDVVFLGKGNDKFDGLAGNDTICGGEGNDTLDGGAGDDWIDAGLGDDKVSVLAGNDHVYGNDGDDTITATVPVADIHAGAGDDIAYVTHLTSGLSMNAGDDTVVFDRTSGELRGGKGEDAFLVATPTPAPGEPAPGLNTATTSVLKGGSGVDTFTLAPLTVPVRIDEAEVLSWAPDRAVVRLTVSAGFYVRAFAYDLGEALGSGACLDALRRTRSGAFDLSTAVTLDQLREGHGAEALLGLDLLLPDWETAVVGPEGRQRLSHGQTLLPSHLLERQTGQSAPWARVVDEAGHLLGLAKEESGDGTLHPDIVLI